MVIEVMHRTQYRYSQPVYLDPHVLRLRPRCDGTQVVRDFTFHVEPQPTGWSDSCDVEGNAVTHVWFTGLTQELTVMSRSIVDTQRRNPFDYLLTDRVAESLPIQYAGDLVPMLTPYCVPMASSHDVMQFALGVANEAEHKTLPFLSLLARCISEHCQYTVREFDDPFPAEVTLLQRVGSCRDLAVLFIEACRVLGIAARFVSGYQVSLPGVEHRLHAWAEVYLPGGGWRGYDPTAGTAVADQHVAVSAGSIPVHAAPIEGSLRSTSVRSTMDVHLQVRPADNALLSPRSFGCGSVSDTKDER